MAVTEPAGERREPDGLASPSSDDTLRDDNAAKNNAAGSDANAEPATKSKRLVSLDAFRGLTILGMLLVNNIALSENTPRHLKHAEWSGAVHFADFVFPWFLLIVGVALPYAAASQRKSGLTGTRRASRVLARTASLVALGILVDSVVARQFSPGLGVLQVIGLAYGCASLFYELPALWRALFAASLLILHWAMIRFVAIPGVGAGHFHETTNLIVYVNQRYLAPYHLNGLASVVPTTALALIGTLIGDLLRIKPAAASADRALSWRKLAILTVGALALVVVGVWWSRDLPMNKPLWTAPYIVYTAGCGALALGGLFLVVDILGGSALAFPLVVPGSNAIAAYVLPILVKILVLQTVHAPGALPGVTLQQALQNACYASAGRVTGGWLYTASYIGFWWLVLLVFYRRKWFLRV